MSDRGDSQEREQQSVAELVLRASLPRRVLGGLWHFARRKPLGAAGGVVVVLLVIVGIEPSLFAKQSFEQIDLANRFAPPSWDNFFGTDNTGRDVFSRVLYGAQTSVLIGFSAVIISGVLSVVIGAVSAYFRGWVDIVIQRVVDTWLAFPGLIFVLFIVSIFGNNRTALVMILGILFAAGTSRIIRSATISIRTNSYVEAAQTLGASNSRVLVRHILPNLMPIIIVNASVQIGEMILVESALAFLGYGTPPPFPSWGRMLQEAQTQMVQNPHLALFPGAALTLTVFAFNMWGDALRDVLDPRMRGAD